MANTGRFRIERNRVRPKKHRFTFTWTVHDKGSTFRQASMEANNKLSIGPLAAVEAVWCPGPNDGGAHSQCVKWTRKATAAATCCFPIRPALAASSAPGGVKPGFALIKVGGGVFPGNLAGKTASLRWSPGEKTSRERPSQVQLVRGSSKLQIFGRPAADVRERKRRQHISQVCLCPALPLTAFEKAGCYPSSNEQRHERRRVIDCSLSYLFHTSVFS